MTAYDQDLYRCYGQADSAPNPKARIRCTIRAMVRSHLGGVAATLQCLSFRIMVVGLFV